MISFCRLVYDGWMCWGGVAMEASPFQVGEYDTGVSQDLASPMWC